MIEWSATPRRRYPEFLRGGAGAPSPSQTSSQVGRSSRARVCVAGSAEPPRRFADLGRVETHRARHLAQHRGCARAAPPECARPSPRGAGERFPRATVGGRIACANTPCSIAPRQRLIASRSEPTSSGTICIRPPPPRIPRPPARGEARVRLSAAARRGAGAPAAARAPPAPPPSPAGPVQSSRSAGAPC